MKIRIKDNNIRLRLTKSEVELVAREGQVTAETAFPEGKTFAYRLTATNDGQPSAHFEQGVIELRFPKQDLQRWADSEEVSLSAQCKTVELLVEKDFTCLSIREEEQNGDYYPHPLQKS